MSNNNQSTIVAPVPMQVPIPLVAGTIGGAVSTILLYPLDLVKVRLQVNESSMSTSTPTPTSTSISKQQQQPIKQKLSTGSMVHMLRGIIRHEGFIGLYNGLTPAIVGSAASWGGYFFLYEGMKIRLLERKRGISTDDGTTNGCGDIKLGPKENFAAACASGAVMVGLTNPIWLIKTRMQLQMKRCQEEKKKLLFSSSASKSGSISNSATSAAIDKIKPPYKNMFDAARTIFREEGLAGLYKGSIPALMLVSHGGVQFVCYEFLKGHFGIYQKKEKAASRERGTSLTTTQSRSGIFNRLGDSLGYLTMGAISKIVATTATYPLQVIKSRLQQRSQTVELSASGGIEIVERRYAGVTDCAKRIWMREGVSGFFKGCIPNAIRVAPSAAITFVVYESMVDFMTNDRLD